MKRRRKKKNKKKGKKERRKKVGVSDQLVVIDVPFQGDSPSVH